MDVPETQSVLSRRTALAGATAVLTGTAGCLQRLRNVAGRSRQQQLTIEISIPPGDYDPFAAPIARHLIDGLEAVGIDYRLTPMPRDELYRRVLLTHEFDVYISRLPYTRRPDPDVLYPLFHSRFRGEGGWQNPFGFTNLDCDELLDTQRRTDGDRRREAVETLQELLARTQPFVPLVLPELLTGARTDRFRGWERAVDRMPYGLLDLDRQDAPNRELRLSSTDVRITENRNPISATHSHDGSLIELLYDPLAARRGDEIVPWLASEIQWDDADGLLQAEITLREGLTWHDTEPLTAEDVVFTYEFLTDTSRGEATNPVPAPRFRGPVTLVSNANAQGSRTVRLTFGDTSRTVATQTLTIPIFPRHIWQEQTETVSLAGIEIDSSTTEALVWDNPEPVGSGPIQFEEADAGRTITMSRFEDHFLTRLDQPLSEPSLQAPAFDILSVDTALSGTGVVESLAAGDIDATLSPVDPERIERIREEPSLSLYATRSYGSYHLGFNNRTEPFSDPNFRRTLARLFDKKALAANVFGGYGEPIASPLAGTDWLAEALEWSDTDPAVPFLGTEGVVDAETAREAFREAGYQYNTDGELVV